MNKEIQYKIYSGGYNNYLYTLIPENKKVLDVGCNTGYLGEKLIKDKKCTVYGIDYSKNAIDVAKKKLNYAKVFDLETYTLPFPNDKFDVIIFGDVLEHVRQPEKVLLLFKKMLNKDGIIISSIPNVANINVRLSLLFGNWNYQQWGILDQTHLRFFTKKSIKKLFTENNYEIIDIHSTPGFHFIVLRYFKILKYIAKMLCKVYPKLFALQFIIIARSKK